MFCIHQSYFIFGQIGQHNTCTLSNQTSTSRPPNQTLTNNPHKHIQIHILSSLFINSKAVSFVKIFCIAININIWADIIFYLIVVLVDYGPIRIFKYNCSICWQCSECYLWVIDSITTMLPITDKTTDPILSEIFCCMCVRWLLGCGDRYGLLQYSIVAIYVIFYSYIRANSPGRQQTLVLAYKEFLQQQ